MLYVPFYTFQRMKPSHMQTIESAKQSITALLLPGYEIEFLVE